jgi:hypothetical protein
VPSRLDPMLEPLGISRRKPLFPSLFHAPAKQIESCHFFSHLDGARKVISLSTPWIANSP